MICSPATTSSTIDFPFWQPIGQSIIMLFEEDWVMREMSPLCHLLCLYCLHLKRFSLFFFLPMSGGIIFQGDGYSEAHWLTSVFGCKESRGMEMSPRCMWQWTGKKTRAGEAGAILLHWIKFRKKTNTDPKPTRQEPQPHHLMWISTRYRYISTKEQPALFADSADTRRLAQNLLVSRHE